MTYASEGHIPSGCAIAALIDRSGQRVPGSVIVQLMASMRERVTDLGAGYAGYGIYPEMRNYYAFHIMYASGAAQVQTEELLHRHFYVERDEVIPTRQVESITDSPLLRRYFLRPTSIALAEKRLKDDDEYVRQTVMHINADIDGAYVFSSGRNMGVFKGVGYPEDIGEFYRLDEYEAYIWTAHGRFPTNTTGWWGGAHPFGLLDWSVVHNGEISSYGINRRYLGNYGYECLLHTDTEVIAYMFDLLVRKHKMPLELACVAMAPPFYQKIEKMAPDDAAVVKAIRMVYGGALLNGPFSVAVATRKMMMGFNDRIKLRPMWVASKDDMRYIASEEAAIRVIEPNPDRVWMARGGEPVIFTLENAEVVHA